VGLGCSFLPPSIARCYPLSERLMRSRYSWPPGTQSYGPIRPCVVRQARSVGLQSLIRLSRLGVLHRRIKGAVFEQNHGSLTSFWCLSLLLAALLPPPFPTSAFVIGAGVTRYRLIALCCLSGQDGCAALLYWFTSHLCSAGGSSQACGRLTRCYF
jgi:hypothetical protein